MSEPMVNIQLLLKRLDRKMESVVMRELNPSGLSLTQMMTLRLIREEPKTIGEISKNLGLSNGTVSGVIDRLEREQWVERIRDAEDRRVVWIHKTDKFEKIREKFPTLQEIYSREVFPGLTQKEMEQFVASLQKMDHSITEKIKER
jgi:DNA-binding MarR family transcriptional regulator